MCCQLEISHLYVGIVTIMTSFSGFHQKTFKPESREYCLTESFEAKCADDEAILVTEARFGRIGLGRCVTRNYGYLGCSKDALLLVDTRCSGRHQCKFSVADPDVGLLNLKPCPKDFSPYLEAAYSCNKVATCQDLKCQSSNYLSLSAGTGYLSSLVASQLGCGSKDCPWVIKAQPGQRLNITLLDFAISSRNASRSIRHRPGYPLYCHEYAVVKENTVPRSATICGGDQRIRSAYISTTHKLEIEIVNRKPGRNLEYFLLKFDVIGCPTLIPPTQGWIQRSEGGAVVRCNNSKESWSMMCKGTSWVGEMRNCSEDKPLWGIEEFSGGIGLPSVGVSVLIIFGVALVVVIYIAVSIVCVLYFRRRHRRRNRQMSSMAPETILPDGMERSQNTTIDGLYEERTPMLLKNHKCFHTGESDYGDICEMQLLRSALGTDQKSGRTAAILKCQVSRTLPRSADECPGHAQHIENRNVLPFGSLNTFKPPGQCDQNLYEPATNKDQKAVIPDHIRLYHELDPSLLPNCHGALQDAMFVVSNENAHIQENMPNVIPEGVDNDANNRRENI